MTDLTNYIHGRDVADLMRLADAPSVWRAIATHGEKYTAATGQTVDVVQLSSNGPKLVKRDQLEAFAAWYETAVRYPSRRPHGTEIRISGRKVTAQEERRRRLGAAIRRWQLANGD